MNWLLSRGKVVDDLLLFTGVAISFDKPINSIAALNSALILLRILLNLAQPSGSFDLIAVILNVSRLCIHSFQSAEIFMENF